MATVIKIEKYRPSNGTEGAIFMDAWCSECARDAAMNGGMELDECDDNQLCTIIADTHCYEVDDPNYPDAWRYGADGRPCCAAFVPVGEPIPVPDENTGDLFATEPKE